MTINIKRRSGGEIAALADAVHGSIAETMAARYATVPVSKKRPRTTPHVVLAVKWARLTTKMTAKNIAEARRKARKEAEEAARIYESFDRMMHPVIPFGEDCNGFRTDLSRYM